MSGKLLIVGAGLALGVGLGALSFHWMSRGHGVRPAEASDTASHVPAPSVRAEGRIITRPGGQITLSAQITGTIHRVAVKEGQTVRKGDLLLEFNKEEHIAALSEAYASVGEADARLRARQDDARRTKALIESGAIAERSNVEVTSERNAAAARRAAANAAARRISTTIEKTKVLSPLDGVVITRNVEPAETVALGAPLVTVADLTSLRVEAEVDEFDIGRVAIGQSVVVTADGFPGQSWVGTVDEIPSAVTSRRLRPQDPARPTDARVLLVKITLPEGTPLKLGQRVNTAFEAAAPSQGEVPIKVK